MNKRNTAKEKKKRNKSFPYKSQLSLSTNTNRYPKYAIVNEKGKILEKFRLRATTNQTLPYYKEKYFPMKLEIIRL